MLEQCQKMLNRDQRTIKKEKHLQEKIEKMQLEACHKKREKNQEGNKQEKWTGLQENILIWCWECKQRKKMQNIG